MPRRLPGDAHLGGTTLIRPKPIDAFIAAGLVISALAAASARAPRPKVADKLIAESAVIQLGDVKQGESVAFHFPIRATGSRGIRIDEASRPCICTELDLPANTIIAAGQTRSIHGRIKTDGRRGPLRMAFALSYSDDSTTSGDGSIRNTLVIPLTMNVLPSIKSSVDSLELDGGEWSSLSLLPGGVPDFQVTGIEVSAPFLEYELVRSVLGQRGDRFEVRLRANPAKRPDLPGHDWGASWVKFNTTEPKELEIQIPITFRRKP